MEGLYYQIEEEQVRINKLKKFLILLLIILLPYHHMVISVLLQDFGFLKFWKEAVIAILVAITFFEQIIGKKRVKFNLVEWLSVLFIVIMTVYTIISDNRYQAAYIARIYVMPVMLIFVVRRMNIDKEDIRKTMEAVIINTVILSVWGVFQAQILGDGFLINLGYQTQRVSHMIKLKNEFYMLGGNFMQRVTSTFAAPNTFGMYLAMVITFMTYLKKRLGINIKLYYISAGIFVATLILTFSRTSWICCVVALILFYIEYINWTKQMWIRIIKITIACGLIFVVADLVILRTGIVSGMYRLIFNTITGRDSSLIGHITSFGGSIVKVVKNPLGLGLGNNGPRAKVFMSKPNLVESSYSLMAYEVGIIGMAVYFAAYFVALRDNIRIFREDKSKFILSVRGVILIMLVGFLSLPFIQDFELTVFTYIYIALQYIDGVSGKGIKGKEDAGSITGRRIGNKA